MSNNPKVGGNMWKKSCGRSLVLLSIAHQYQTLTFDFLDANEVTLTLVDLTQPILHMFILVISFFLLIVFFIIITVNFFSYLVNRRYLSGPGWMRFMEVWTLIIAPLIFLTVFDIGQINDCCSDSAVFSPDDRISIYLLICLCIIAYFYSSYRSNLSTPVIELLINTMLLTGAFLNILIAIQVYTDGFGVFMMLTGNLSVIMLFIMMMKKNKDLLDDALQEGTVAPRNVLASFSLSILRSKAWIRYPVLAVLALPLLLFLSLLLYLFGQRPDTLIRAFTDTYKHGFSQLDHLCDNVQCGGHFLCSVAAKGHKAIVNPERYGERNGKRIICNRQLLVANAFEELMQRHLPVVHKQVRRQYNKVGNLVHRYYFVFDRKIVADIVYLFMKPLEWFFLLVLYTFDKRPEDRIARQYLSIADRMRIQELEQNQAMATS